MKLRPKFRNKKLVVFDLDGTLTKTKSNLEFEMSRALNALLKEKRVAVIGGGTYVQFEKQFVAELKCPPSLLSRLFIFPTTATSFYRYHNGWKRIYSFELSKRERAGIQKAFQETLQEIRYVPPKRIYGKVIEDRRTQVTFSALGQDVVAVLGKKGVLLKEKWTRENTPLKLKIARMMQKRLPGLEVHAAGFTSIDVTRRGIDKKYGVRQIAKHLRMSIKDMLFVGDAIFPGGNDYAAVKTGVDYVKVSGPEETKKVIKFLLSTSFPHKKHSLRFRGRGRTIM
ncbi:HAD-IIB family hydrolase [Candidatus Parcubacteria bacterium]|nr:MAG: HAD-IIB family hydrolase [Candidatus Parcubacteria bacterium]